MIPRSFPRTHLRPRAVTLAVAGIFGATLLLGGCGGSSSSTPDTTPNSIELSALGSYQSGSFLTSAAEIVSYDPVTQRLYVVNAGARTVDVLDISAPETPRKLFSIDATQYGESANSVAIRNGIVAIAVDATPKTDPGQVVFFDGNANFLAKVSVGALPDALAFTPDGRYLLVANEGEPSDDYQTDPEGSVSVIDISGGVASITQDKVRSADFRAFNNQADALRAAGVRIFGPGASVAQDLEPEWVSVTPDSRTAYVSLQENNAIAELDIASATITRILPLGFKDHNQAGMGLDASDRDNAINIRPWPLFGIYQPDSIEVFADGGRTYIATANEGDARDYSAYSEEHRISSLTLDPTAFPNAAELQKNENLGRLRITSSMGYLPTPECVASVTVSGSPDNCVYERLYSYGARSMSIFELTSTGLNRVFDSGDEMEQVVAQTYPQQFNANHSSNSSFDARSPNKGPEPEGIAIGEIDGKRYAFVGLERIGGVMVYDITQPQAASFVQYINHRNFSLPDTPEALTTTDLGAEGLRFIPAAQSPNGVPLLAVGNEVSGTTTLFRIDSVRR